MDTTVNLKPVLTWFTKNSIPEEYKDLQIRQVYCWIYTSDNKIIIVSKDGEKWQFPGGHPFEGETLIETCLREVEEETGINLSKYEQNIKMFGYYVVKKFDPNKNKYIDFVQTRFFVKLNESSNDLDLKPKEKESEDALEKITDVKATSIDDACIIIPWLRDTTELLAFEKNIE